VVFYAHKAEKFYGVKLFAASLRKIFQLPWLFALVLSHGAVQLVPSLYALS
jgi:hypothetical protein